ncbi:hypothetical protein XarbCFBP7629_05725 [Xanthomonas arboricola]|nr:hypothetical protein XarbCFBP7629_05725 [Xanthomonas arboricola]
MECHGTTCAIAAMERSGPLLNQQSKRLHCLQKMGPVCVRICQACGQIACASHWRGAEQLANIAEHLTCGLVTLSMGEYSVVAIHLDENRGKGLFCSCARHSYHGSEGCFWRSLDMPYRRGSGAHGQCKAVHACLE